MIQVPRKIIFAIIFGALYLSLTAFIPYGYHFSALECCDMCEDFVFSHKHLILVFCAALSFFIPALRKINGWKGFFETVLVSYLCFQIYSFEEIYDFIFVQNCFFPQHFTEI